jgi:alkylation response protein AidB-like acyl-CoA dehydrogenase
MDFALSNEQCAWQMTARKFAQEEIRPISLQRDEIEDPRETFDWEIIKKGSRLGFRTMAVPKEWGGHGTDFVTQALVMAELARGDSAMLERSGRPLPEVYDLLQRHFTHFIDLRGDSGDRVRRTSELHTALAYVETGRRSYTNVLLYTSA